MGPKVSLLANARLPLRRHSVADFSNAPRFTHFRHTMLKYVDLYRYSDGVALIGRRHNRPGADNSALAPRMRALPNVGRYKAGPTVHGGEGARPHASVPCFVVPWTLQSINRHTRCSRPLGYELTCRGLLRWSRSHSCRSATFTRPRSLAASRLFASVPPCSVSKSVANPLSDKYSRPAVSDALFVDNRRYP